MATRAENRARTRYRIAAAAAQLFADRGYDQVLVVDVARAADVSEQTVYNYFPAKQDLVLDQAESILDRYRDAVTGRAPTVHPGQAVRDLIRADTTWLGAADLGPARGMFLALAVSSPTFRRFALQFRERQATVVAEALAETDPDLPAMLARAYAAALVAIAQDVADTVGHHIAGTTPIGPSAADADRARADLQARVDQSLERLDRAFRVLGPDPAGPD